MKKSKNRKPTVNELKNVCTNLIHRVEQLNNVLFTLDSIIAKYIDFKNDKNKFQEYLNKEKANVKYKSEDSGKSATGDREAKVKSIKPAKK